MVMMVPAMDYSVVEFVILMVFLYWVFPSVFLQGFSSINKMVDLLSNRVFDAFNRFSPSEGVQNESLSNVSALKRFTNEQRNRKLILRMAEKQARDSYLYDIKENLPPAVLPKRRPYMGLNCQGCMSESRESYLSDSTKKHTLKNILKWTPMANSSYSLVQKVFNHLAQVYELKKHDYPQVAGKVLKDDRIKMAIEKAAVQQFQDESEKGEEHYQFLIKNNQRRATKLLREMRSTLSDFLLRFTSWVLYKLLPCFLSGVVVHPGQVEMLQKAADTGLPLIFLPLHRSHLDYILMSFILLNNNIRCPLVAAGNNMRIPFFGQLLCGLGAFFIKRRIDPIKGRKDHVYKAILHTYMKECLKAGHNIEFFLEGGRTRTGKPCMPKYGILSVIIDAYMDGTIEDALLVPISVNYEKLVDGNFVREQMGQPKEMETFTGALKGIWHVLNSDYGSMRIDFNQPYSVKELARTFNNDGKMPTNGHVPLRRLKSNPSSASLYGTDVVSEEHKHLVENISRHIIYDCSQSTSVMSTNAVAFLLLNKFRNGGTSEEIARSIDDLREELRRARRDVGFSGDAIDVLYYAMEILGPELITKEETDSGVLIRPVIKLPNVIELTYYSNTLLGYYVLNSVLATAMLPLNTKDDRVVQKELIESALDFCNLLQYEFILCKPCQKLESFVMDVIDDFITKHEIFLEENNQQIDKEYHGGRRIPNPMLDEDSDYSEQEEVVITYEINRNSKTTESLAFMRGVLKPIVEAYSITALCLENLVGKEMLENDFVNDVIKEMQKQLQLGTLTYEESVTVDSIKNALKVYQKWGVLECHTENKLRLYYLKDIHDDKESVRKIYEKVNRFRLSPVILDDN